VRIDHKGSSARWNSTSRKGWKFRTRILAYYIASRKPWTCLAVNLAIVSRWTYKSKLIWEGARKHNLTASCSTDSVAKSHICGSLKADESDLLESSSGGNNCFIFLFKVSRKECQRLRGGEEKMMDWFWAWFIQHY